MINIECCVEDITSAVRGVLGGANRLEVCNRLDLGGITPSLDLVANILHKVKRRCGTEVMIMIRPERGGNFVYSEEEVFGMMQSIEMFHSNSVEDGIQPNGFVFGCLLENGRIDQNTLHILCNHVRKLSKKYEITFHRAIDECTDVFEALEVCSRIPNITRILSSGQKPNAFDGRYNLKQMNEYLLLLPRLKNHHLTIMCGAGINPRNVREIVYTSGCKEVHGTFRNDGVSSLSNPVQLQEHVVYKILENLR